MNDNKTNYVITLAIGNFLKLSRQLLTKGPVSRDTNHFDFFTTAWKFKAIIAGQQAISPVANNL